MSKHWVKVPKNLTQYKDSVGAGLMHLALGHFEVPAREPERDPLVSVLFNLSEQSEAYLDELVKEHTKRIIFKTALIWLARQPKHIQSSKV